MLQEYMPELVKDNSVKLFFVKFGGKVRIEHETAAVRRGGWNTLFLAPRSVEQKGPEKRATLQQLDSGFNEAFFEIGWGHGGVWGIGGGEGKLLPGSIN
jgi:hypothetical protein